MKFLKLTFKALTYKKCTIHLNKEGTYLILGENKDTGGSNGSGKTIPYIVLYNTIFGTTPYGISKYELLYKDDTYYSKLSFIGKDRNKYRVEQYIKHKKFGTCIKIFNKEGKDIAPRKYPDAQKKVQELAGITKEDFLNFIYISSHSTHTLIYGKDTERMNYISQLFKLHRFDAIKKALMLKRRGIIERLEELNKNKILLESVNDRLKTLPGIEKLNKILDRYENKKIEYKTKLENLKSKKESIGVMKNDYETYSDLVQQLKEIGHIDKEEVEHVFVYEKKIKSMQNEINHKNLLLEKRSEYIRIKEKIKDINEKITDDQVTQNDIFELNKKLSNYENIQENIDRIKEIEKKIDKDLLKENIQELENTLKEKENRFAIVESSLSKKNADINFYKTQDKPVCPTCRRKIDLDFVKSKIKELKEEAETYKSKYVKLDKSITQLNILIANVKKNKEYHNELKTLLADVDIKDEDITVKIEKIKNKIEIKTENLELLQKLDKYKEDSLAYKTLEFPEKDEIKENERELESLQSKLKKIEKASVVYKQLEKFNKNKIEHLKSENFEVKLKKINTMIEEVEKEYHGIIEKSQSFKSYKDNVEALLEEKKKYEDLLIGYDKLNKKLFLVNKLIECYDPKKGLKVLKIKKISKLITSNLRKYTPLMFNEKDISFITQSDSDIVKFLVKRVFTKKDKNGKVISSYERIYDVKGLSSGEKSKLEKIFIPTLYSLVAKDKLCNFLCLDEVDKNLDTKGNYYFSNFFLPALKNMVKNLRVISHNNSIKGAKYYDGVYNVVKYKGKSKIKNINI